MHRRAADAQSGRQRTDGPARGGRRTGEQDTHARVGVSSDRYFAASAWCVMHESHRAASLKTSAPQRDRVRADTKTLRDFPRRAPFGREEHDARSPRDSLGCRAGPNPGAQELPIAFGDPKSLSPHVATRSSNPATRRILQMEVIRNYTCNSGTARPSGDKITAELS